MEEELKRQEEEKAEIENRLRERMAKQQQDEEVKLDPSVPMSSQQAASSQEQYNDAPPYYQPNIVPQAPLTEDGKELFDAFIAKLLNPFTPVEELKEMYMRPIPPKIGQIQCTITRHKNGMNRFWPKYTLSLSSTNQFLLTGKKRAGNKTSNYMISMDQEKVGKNGTGFLGKVRSNFLGTEFSIYDHGKNPDSSKSQEEVREQHGVVQYETNVLGSKGPRRMKVLLPMVDFHGTQTVWKSNDVSDNKNAVLTSIKS